MSLFISFFIRHKITSIVIGVPRIKKAYLLSGELEPKVEDNSNPYYYLQWIEMLVNDMVSVTED